MAKSRSIWLPVVVFFAVLAGVLFGLNAYQRVWTDGVQASLREQTEKVSQSLEKHLARSFASVDIFAGVVRVNGGVIPDFESYAQELTRVVPGVHAIAIAPNGMVHALYPEGLGRDPLLRQFFGGQSHEAAAPHPQPTLTRAIRLSSGLRVLTIRRDVFVPDAAGGENWWGYVAAIVDVEDALRAVGLHVDRSDGPGFELLQAGAHVAGRGTTVPGVERPVDLPGGPWRLRIGLGAPQPNAPYLLPLGLCAFMLAGLAAFAVAYLLRRINTPIEFRQHNTMELKRLAFHDALTGLENRKLFQERLRQELDKADQNGKRVALLYLDLDHFKRVNDTLGHSAGDTLLRILAQRLRAGVRHGDSVARVGGDEFAVILGNLTESDHAALVARKLLESFREPIQVDGNDLFASVSIGIAISPEHGREAELLMRHADSAMYHAKGRGRNAFQIFNRRMKIGVVRSISMENELRRGLQNREFSLSFEPQLAIDTRQITGMEALLRWRVPEGGERQPQQFMAAAEESGLVIPLGNWMLHEALSRAEELRAGGPRTLGLSVNVATRQLFEPEFYRRLVTALEKTGYDPRQLTLEITEDALFDFPAEIAQVLAQVRALGITIAIDNFGTGYSPVSFLSKLPVTVVKLDREIVRGIPHDQRDAELAATLIANAHQHNLVVVAQGIERSGQLDFLRDNRCDLGQGRLFQDEEELLSIWLETSETGFPLTSFG